MPLATAVEAAFQPEVVARDSTRIYVFAVNANGRRPEKPERVGRLDGLDCAQRDPMRIAAGFGDEVAQTRQEALVGRTTFEVEKLDLHALQYAGAGDVLVGSPPDGTARTSASWIVVAASPRRTPTSEQSPW